MSEFREGSMRGNVKSSNSLRPVKPPPAPQPIKCKECHGLGRECMAGCSAHPDNWYDCDKCGGTGRVIPQ